MSRKTIIISTVCMLVALLGAAVGATYAWYTAREGAGTDMTLEANGYLVVYFDEEINTNETPLKPARAAKYAITNNVTGLDVLTENEYIAEAASVAELTANFAYINASSKTGSVPATEMTFDCRAFLVMPDDTLKELDLTRDISVTLSLGGDYADPTKTFVGGEVAWGEAIDIGGDIDLVLTVNAYFLQPDELCDPVIREGKAIRIKITVRADADEEEEE